MVHSASKLAHSIRFARLGTYLSGQLAGASQDRPARFSLAVSNDHGFGVQGHGGANVPGDAIEARADGKPIGLCGFDDQVLFVP